MRFPPANLARKTAIQPSRSSFDVLLGGHPSVVDSSTAANSSRSPSARGQQRSPGQALQFLERESRHKLVCEEPTRRDVDHREIGVEALHHADPGERISTAEHDLRFPALREVLHHHPYVL